MDTQPKQILDIALALSEDERGKLAATLIRSLDAAPDQNTDAAWAHEIEKRLTSIDNGSVELNSFDAVMSKMRARRNG